MMDKLMDMMGRKRAGAGRGFVNPHTVDEVERSKKMREEEFEATPAEVRDRAMRRKATEAYEAARSTPMAKGGKVSSASRRADGIAQRGKTKGRMI